MKVEVRILPRASLSLGDFAELWRARDLFSMLVWRDFAVRYKQTVLGPVWFVIQPLLPTLVFTLVFGMIVGVSTDGIPGFLFYLCNQIVWGYFATCYSSTAGSLISNMHLFTKVYLPRLVVPLASLASNAISVVVQLGMFAVAWVWFAQSPDTTFALELSVRIVWVPLLLLLVAMQGLGFGLWMAAITAKYRDLQQVSLVIIQLWMYGSAVIFPLSAVPVEYRPLVELNPVTFVVEAFRLCLLGVGTISADMAFYSVGISLLVLTGGLLVFNRTARTFADIA